MLDIERLLELLRGTYDVREWWPSDSPFEVMVGAVLTQQTAWESVAKVLDRLRAEGLLEVDRMASVDLDVLESILKPVGFYRQKAKRIRELATYIVDTSRFRSDAPSDRTDGFGEEGTVVSRRDRERDGRFHSGVRSGEGQVRGGGIFIQDAEPHRRAMLRGLR